MIRFAFFLKTYIGDINRVERLVESYRRFNVENIRLFLMCPEEDVSTFSRFQGEDISVLSEKRIDTEIFTEDSDWTAGYLNQEIYKLAFWELGLCENYLCLDSDGLFIRPFYFRDFMYDEYTPYTVLIEDNDLKADLYYNKMYWVAREERLFKIQDEMEYHPYKMMTCHGFQVFSAQVLRSLKDDYMLPRTYTYKKLIEISPYEFSWYNFWIQKKECIPIKPCEPFFKVFHLKQHHINEVLRGMKVEDWARGYVGIVVNSNYGIGDGVYDNMSIYTRKNSGLTEQSIYESYKFYKRLMRGRNIRMVKKLICRIIKGAE